jgi:hypothetical protein
MRRNRTIYALLVVGTIAAGLATRSNLFYMPPMFGKYPGDCLWAAMMFWAVGMVFPGLSTSRTAGLVVLICFTVETMKLLPWDWLSSIRPTALGHLMLGRVDLAELYRLFGWGYTCESRRGVHRETTRITRNLKRTVKSLSHTLMPARLGLVRPRGFCILRSAFCLQGGVPLARRAVEVFWC